MTEGKYGWKVGQSKSGSLDLKVVLSRSPKNHFRFTAHWHACMCIRTDLLLTLDFLFSWNNSGLRLCFATLRLSGHFYLSRREQRSERPDKHAANSFTLTETKTLVSSVGIAGPGAPLFP